MKKIKILLALLLVFVLSGCNNSKKEEFEYKKVNDYLYEIIYDDYEYDKNLETVIPVEKFGCSSVKNGNFYGRNFDFIYNDIPEFVVKVNKKEERHASIGLTYLSTIHKGDDIEQFKDQLKLTPNFTLDGINDSGVIASINVVPKQDVALLEGTNPEGEDLHIAFAVRYVLDNADSADNAIELLGKRNIYGDVGEHYNLHIMIADENKTYVVEFIDNKMVAEEKVGNEQIMTNYYVNLDYLTENASGVERYKILQENYDEGNSFDGMWNLMKRVQYSKAYLFDNEVEWYTEFIPQSIMKELNTEKGAEYLKLLDDMKKEYWVALAYEKRTPANSSFWITTHNSIYDIKERKLRVTIQEDYDNYYEYYLNEK